jgi:glycosyltransferase involved in cell wall biosynthesis
MTSRQRVVMVATSYPRFPGDTVGTFMEPIAQGLAARGHDVHMVLPWHPQWQRGEGDGHVSFHLFKYAPIRSLNLFGYAGALEADQWLRGAAVAAAPFAMASGWREAARVARRIDATLLHGHWVVPGGVIAAAASGGRPLVISLHGSDVFVAERHALVGQAARWAFGRAGFVTACSDDLRGRALGLGASAERSATVPYGVDSTRFRPDPAARTRLRERWGAGDDAEIVIGAGRFVRKKGFEFLIDAVARLAPTRPGLRLVLAGDGDLRREFEKRIGDRGVDTRTILPGVLHQDDIAASLAAADVVVVPSVRDPSGNVDGLPNVVMEALASATPLIATPAGGIASVVVDGRTGVLVPEADAAALATAIARLLEDRPAAKALGVAARQWAERNGSWSHALDSFERAYEIACRPANGRAVSTTTR